LSQDKQRKSSGTNTNLLEDQIILVVSTEISSLESFGVNESLEQVFEPASSLKSIIMTSDDRNRDENELNDFVNQAEMDLTRGFHPGWQHGANDQTARCNGRALQELSAKAQRVLPTPLSLTQLWRLP
jgi:hypothetical protein